ncbi:hypothetical protein GCM10009639_50310 [Kitasatospora putterlickiae]|uniref:Uncharacterized protein n=1 Tax=Kitasatospora putterlickiae TaxID=221725 RepID=A0ABP4J0N6_9ACTN
MTDEVDERRAAREEQRRREREWTAEFERRASAADAARAERARAERTAALRAAWAGGERGGSHSFAEVTGPDGGEPVRIAVAWLGRHRAVARAFRDGPTHGQISDPLGIAIVAVAALVLGLDHGIRRLILRLSDRPRWAVVAAVGPDGKPVLVHHDRDERPVALAAAALADRVEREGPTALRPTGGRP